MLRRISLALWPWSLAGVAFAGIGLWLAKRAIAAIDPPLPTVEEILAFDQRADLPVSVTWINTASQKMPRSAVLDASLDPTPASPYVMSHPSFVLEWGDGRMFLIDAGMDRESAAAFGRPLEWVSGAEPIEPLGSTAEQLGPAALARVRGIAFTHEHTDHTEGVADLCRLRTKPLALFQNSLQVEESNFTTRPGQRQIAEARLPRAQAGRDRPAQGRARVLRPARSSRRRATRRARRSSWPTCAAAMRCAPGSSPATS